MKKTVAFLLALLLLVSLTACKSKNAEENPESSSPAGQVPETEAAQPQTEAESGEKTEAPAAEPSQSESVTAPAVTTPDELVGTWVLSGNNDAEKLEAAFPQVKELGGELQIGMDGLMFWTLGTSGGMGSFTVDGDTLNAEIYSDYTGAPESVICTVEGGDTLTMDYSGVTIIWVKD